MEKNFLDIIVSPEILERIFVSLSYKDLMVICNANRELRYFCQTNDYLWHQKVLYDFEDLYEIDPRSGPEHSDNWRKEYQYYRQKIRTYIENSYAKYVEFVKNSTFNEYWLNPKILTSPEDAALIMAMTENNVKMVYFLLKYHDVNVNPNAEVEGNEYGRTILLDATEKNRVEIVELLLEAGADPNIQNEHEITPLIIASKKGHIEIVELLLKAGADPDIGDQFDMTPLLYARIFRHPKIVELLS